MLRSNLPPTTPEIPVAYLTVITVMRNGAHLVFQTPLIEDQDMRARLLGHMTVRKLYAQKFVSHFVAVLGTELPELFEVGS